MPLDYVHADTLTAAELARYRLVVLPYPLMLSGRTAAELREYVRAGGALVAEARAGWNDERGRAAEVIPGLGLAEVVGARESDVQTVEKGKAALVSAGDGLPGLSAGETLPGRWYEESLLAVSPSARVVARFASGAPAAVVSSFGKGRALLLGSYVSAGYVAQPEETTRRFYAGLLDWAGVDAAGRRRPATRSRCGSSSRAASTWPSSSTTPRLRPPTAVTLRVPLAGRVVEEIASGEAVAAKPTADGFEWRGTIPPRDVRVLSAGYITQPEETTRRFYAGLLDWAGVARPVAATGRPGRGAAPRVGPRAPGLRLQPRRDPGHDGGHAARAPRRARGRGDRERQRQWPCSRPPTGSSGGAPIPPRDVRVLRIH